MFATLKMELWLPSLCVVIGVLLAVFIFEHSYLIFRGVEELTESRIVLMLSLIGIEILLMVALFLLRKKI